MITISTLDYSSWGNARYGSSLSCTEVAGTVADNKIIGQCPICKEENILYSNKKSTYHCKHFLQTQGMFPYIIFIFYRVECTIFPFDETQEFLSRLHTGRSKNKIINKLNSDNYIDCISTEWEVVIMHWLSKFGTCEYEKKNSKGKNPDIYWQSHDGKITFSADVKTNFDQLDKNYPAYEFCIEAHSIIKKYAPQDSFLDVRFESSTKGVPTIFGKEDFSQNLKHLEEQLVAQKDTFKVENKYTFAIEEHQLEVTFLPTQMYSGIGYRAAYHNQLDKNPLQNGLWKKSQQLVRENNELLGIFLCDAGTSLIDPTIKNFDSVEARRIIPNFFKNEPSIDFVVTFSISTPQFSRFKYEFYINTQKEVNDNTYELKNIFEQNIALMSKHKDYPFSVIQSLENTPRDARKFFE